MEELLRNTTAYKIFCGDAVTGKLSHAYLLNFADSLNLREALKFFARKYFSASEARQIEGEGLLDFKIFPKKGVKLTADDAAGIVADAAIKPALHDKKLYVVSDFDSASPIFQNKLLKVLEEPPEGVYFLLGACSLSPVLPTVRSRVKLLRVPPFTESEVLSALTRRYGTKEGLAEAAKACGGVLGAAQNIVDGGWYASVKSAADELMDFSSLSSVTSAALKYGDFKYKTELLYELQRRFFAEAKRYAEDEDYKGGITQGAALYGAESVNSALADIRFNANFSSLLYTLVLRIAERNSARHSN